MKLSFLNEQLLPRVIEPETADENSIDTLLRYLTEQKSTLKRDLNQYGAILFRGFQIDRKEDLAWVMLRLANRTRSYTGGDSPRKEHAKAVFSSTEFPKSFKLQLHNEMSYLQDYPRYIAFLCLQPPAKGGETPIADSRRVFADMDSEIKMKARDGIKYYKAHPSKNQIFYKILKNLGISFSRTWQEVCETEDYYNAEKKCQQLGYNYAWDGKQHRILYISRVGPSSIRHPVTQEEVWFNQAHVNIFHKDQGLLYYIAKSLYPEPSKRPYHCSYADGSEITADELDEIIRIYDQNSVAFPWQPKDLLFLDNILTAHGRNPYAGNRSVLVSLGDD